MRNITGVTGWVRAAAAVLLLCALAPALAEVKPEVHYDGENIPDDEKPWQESTAKLPPYPDLNALRSFYVSPTTTLGFAIDPASLSVGKDDVIRYTLVIKSSSGANNISYEGLRCGTFEYKVYAYARNQEWSPVKNPQWKQIHEVGPNRPHVVLAKDYFCEVGIKVSADPQVLLKRLTTSQSQYKPY